MGRHDWYGYSPYVSKVEKIKKAKKTLEKMAKIGIVLDPVIIEGRTISRTWWGQSWVKNLERYADYSNRLPRGRSYLRNGSILDLKIDANRITALVSGSSSTPYKVNIAINSIGKSVETEMMEKSRESLHSMQSLLAGDFPAELKEHFFKRDSGLFPSPKEIKLDCSCPDWASMCKHVAAALYGVAVRLDEKPELFFTLRGIDVNSFVITVAKEESAKLLRKAKVKSKRVLFSDESEDDMAELFGIALDSTDENTVSEPRHDEKKKPKTGKTVKKKVSSNVSVKKKSKTENDSASGIKSEKKDAKSSKKSMENAVKKVIKKAVKNLSTTKKAVKKVSAKKVSKKKIVKKKQVI